MQPSGHGEVVLVIDEEPTTPMLMPKFRRAN